MVKSPVEAKSASMDTVTKRPRTRYELSRKATTTFPIPGLRAELGRRCHLTWNHAWRGHAMADKSSRLDSLINPSAGRSRPLDRGGSSVADHVPNLT